MRPTLLLLCTLLLSACASTPPTAKLQGEVFYLQRIALPADAELTVTLEDISLADAPALELARQQQASGGRQVPLPFSLVYSPSAVKPGHRYAVRARIEAGGQLLWVNTDQHSVALDGHDPQPLRIRVNPVHTPESVIH